MSTTAAAPHGDGHDDSLAAPDKPFNGVIIAAIIFTLSTILVFVFGTYQLFEYTTQSAVQSVELSPVDHRLADLRAMEHKQLDGYQWIDQKNNVLRIPVERAEELVRRDWNNRATGTVANPIGGPAQIAAPDPAPVPPVVPQPAQDKNIHPPHRLGLPFAPGAPGHKPVPPAKPKVP